MPETINKPDIAGRRTDMIACGSSGCPSTKPLPNSGKGGNQVNRTGKMTQIGSSR